MWYLASILLATLLSGPSFAEEPEPKYLLVLREWEETSCCSDNYCLAVMPPCHQAVPRYEFYTTLEGLLDRLQTSWSKAENTIRLDNTSWLEVWKLDGQVQLRSWETSEEKTKTQTYTETTRHWALDE